MQSQTSLRVTAWDSGLIKSELLALDLQEIQKEIIFKQYFEVDDSSLTVDADGNILWSGITQDITYTD